MKKKDKGISRVNFIEFLVKLSVVSGKVHTYPLKIYEILRNPLSKIKHNDFEPAPTTEKKPDR